jgi:poly(A) polymerase
VLELTRQTPLCIPRPEHTLSRQHISRGALNVLYQLRKAGYQAFLVGGGVRDVLLGLSPKDFDVVTNALPEQVKSLFARQCRLIGRRFLLAHVHINKEIIEVSTFRAHPDKGGGGVVENGRIVRDNVYGTIEEDAWRRDFTINALYYDISNFSLLDYASGIADLRARAIRLIGDPFLRYQEDPVRMLRAVRFAAKLDFTIVPATAGPISELSGLLNDIPAARLYEEMSKLFFGGHALASFVQLRQYQLFKQLFPYTEACFDDPAVLALVEHALRNTDERVVQHKPIAPAFLLAILLWSPLLRLLPSRFPKGSNQQNVLLEKAQHVLTRQIQHVYIPRRITIIIQEIWLLQWRLTRQGGKKKSLRIMSHPRFRAAYDFLVLRAKVDSSVKKFADWWTQLQHTDDEARQSMLSQHPFSRRHHRGTTKNTRKTKKTALE